MMSLSTTLLVIGAAFIFQIIRSSARHTRSLEEYIKTLKEKIERIEKVIDENGTICVAVKQVDLNRMLQLRDDVERLENMIRHHAEEDAEDKLVLIEWMKMINMSVDGDSVLDSDLEELKEFLTRGDIDPRNMVLDHAYSRDYVGY